MKTILTLGVGFWLGRQLYINYDKKEARQKEAQIKRRLTQFLEDQNFSKAELDRFSSKIIG